MSRIRGIEVKVQKEVLQTRKYGLNEILKRKRNEEQSKDDVEKNQIKDLLLKLPKLDRIFEVHRKIGEGTFSSVYLGSLRQHSALPDTEKRWFAIKHLVPTAHPARIEHELKCLQDMGGKENVIGVELCLRHMDTIVFVMPYIPHKKFSEYVGLMEAGEVRRYMRALLTALRHVHSFGVIHRDVKPSNFLYDRERGRYLLVDFGLAQRLCVAPPENAAPPPPRAAPAAAPVTHPPPAHTNGLRKRTHDESELPSAKRLALDLSVGPARAARAPPPPCLSVAPVGAPLAVTHAAPNGRQADKSAAGALARGRCACSGAGAVCGACSARPAARAPRAGTQGFRPPEVLLKVAPQTTAVDVWAAGVILASVLTARYPLLRASDDVSALAELAALLGTAPLQRAAALMGRRVVMSSSRRGLCLRKLAAHLRGAGAEPRGGGAGGGAGQPCDCCQQPAGCCLCRDENKKPEEFTAGAVVAGFPDCAFSLAARLLEPAPRRRPSAADALLHPFLAGDD